MPLTRVVMHMSSYGYSGKYAVKGKVVEKYALGKGGLAVLVEDEEFNRRYLVEFPSASYPGRPSIDNLFGLLPGKYAGKGEHLEHLLKPGSYLDVIVEGNQGPIRQAYHLNAVYPTAPYGQGSQAKSPWQERAEYFYRHQYGKRPTTRAQHYH